jgi:hypothetical protein
VARQLLRYLGLTVQLKFSCLHFLLFTSTSTSASISPSTLQHPLTSNPSTMSNYALPKSHQDVGSPPHLSKPSQC